MFCKSQNWTLCSIRKYSTLLSTVPWNAFVAHLSDSKSFKLVILWKSFRLFYKMKWHIAFIEWGELPCHQSCKFVKVESYKSKIVLSFLTSERCFENQYLVCRWPKFYSKTKVKYYFPTAAIFFWAQLSRWQIGL